MIVMNGAESGTWERMDRNELEAADDFENEFQFQLLKNTARPPHPSTRTITAVCDLNHRATARPYPRPGRAAFVKG